MKRNVVIFTLLFAVVFIISSLTSCGRGEKNGNDTTSPADISDLTSTDEVSGDTPGDGSLIIVSGGGSDYTLIRPDRSDGSITDAMLALNDAINASYGVKLAVNTDWVKGVSSEDRYETEAKEILLGDTNRRESKEIVASLEEDEYTVRIVGNKLVIAGGTDYATVAALKEFTKKYLSDKGTELKLSGDIILEGKAGIQKIPLTQGADIRIMTFNILGSGNDYATRKVYEIQAILDHLPDIIGFQEVNKDAFNGTLLNSNITKYYAVNAMTHSGTSTVNYTPILYLKSKYTLIEGGVEWQNSRYTKTNTKSLSWAVFEVKETGKRFIVTNYHGSLWADTYDLPAGETHASMKDKAVEWRNDNARQMLSKISSLREKYGELPAISVGDFNFTKSSEAYRIVIDGGLASSQEKATKGATSGIKSTHEVGVHPASGSNIDHVFYSESGFSAVKYVISTRADDLKASDHCPVYADLQFK